jgi:hypothetical protein
MTAEELRIHILQTLKGCREPGDARMLLTEAHLMLFNCSAATQSLFWEALGKDLDAIAGDVARLPDAQPVADVINAAQIEVARYRKQAVSVSSAKPV